MDLEWRRSTRCTDAGCVEVARIGAIVAIRDSKSPAQEALNYTAKEWEAFIAGVKSGEFDDFAVGG
jgi:predicted secreted Zn-dependent protease